MQTTLPAPLNIDDVRLGSLPSSLGFLLRMAQVEVFENFFFELAELGLRPGMFSVLSVIGLNPGIRQGVLAQRLKIKKAHMTKLVRALEDRNFVRRDIPDDDRRSVELTLTQAGREFVARYSDPFYRRGSSKPNPLTAAEEERLAALLRKYLGLEKHVEHEGSGN